MDDDRRNAQGSRSPGTTTIDVLALVFAIVIPIVGLILAIVAKTRSKREGRRTSGLVTAALIVSVVLLAFSIVGLIIAVIFFIAVASQPPAGLPVSAPNANSVVVGVEGDGVAPDDVVTMLKHRLDRAGVEYTSVSADAAGHFVTILPDDTPASAVSAIATVLAAPMDGGFFRVVATGEAPAASDSSVSTDSPISTDDVWSIACDQTLAAPVDVEGGYELLCDTDKQTVYVLQSPADILLTSLTDVSVAGEKIDLHLDDDATLKLGTMTADLQAQTLPQNQLAIVAGTEILTAPSVQAVITDGSLVISKPAQDDEDWIRAVLDVGSTGAQLTVVSVTTVG